MTLPYSNGWTCENCGAFVTYGTFHGCNSGSNTSPYFPLSPINIFTDNALLERIATALERIAKSLEETK
jgi:hypothetical protein